MKNIVQDRFGTAPERGAVSQPVVASGSLVLRPWDAGDAGDVYRACQDLLIQRWTTVPVPYERADADGFITFATEDWESGTGAHFAITALGGGLIGSISLKDITKAATPAAEIGYWIAPWARGRGFAAASLRALTTWARGRGILDLFLLIEPENAASLAVAASAGYARGGGDHDRTAGDGVRFEVGPSSSTHDERDSAVRFV